MKTNNNIKYFNQSIIETLEDLKTQYRKLMMEHHPDRNPDNQEEANKISKIINNEYETLFEIFKNKKRNQQGETYTSNTETKETPEEFINIINELMKYANIKIDLVGSWLWISGETKDIKEVLKNLNFKYAPNKKMWYFTFEAYYKKTKKIYTYEEIKSFYGSSTLKNEEETRQNKKANNKIAFN